MDMIGRWAFPQNADPFHYSRTDLIFTPTFHPLSSYCLLYTYLIWINIWIWPSPPQHPRLNSNRNGFISRHPLGTSMGDRQGPSIGRWHDPPLDHLWYIPLWDCNLLVYVPDSPLSLLIIYDPLTYHHHHPIMTIGNLGIRHDDTTTDGPDQVHLAAVAKQEIQGQIPSYRPPKRTK